MSIQFAVTNLLRASGLPPGMDGILDADLLDWSWRPTGNVEVLAGGERPAVVCGYLGGTLRRAATQPHVTAGRLGTAARESTGAFAVVVSVPGGVRVVTDAGGSVPVYYGRSPAGFALGTDLQEVAAVAGLIRVDDVSVADFLRHGAVCHPYTWYEGVRVLEPGAVTTVTPDGAEVRQYWRPVESPDVCSEAGGSDPCGGLRDWGAALRETVRDALAAGLDGARRVRVLFSGGEDSRSLVGLLPPDLDVRLTTILDGRNREYALARRAAEALGRPLDLVQRPTGFYLTDVPGRVRAAGPGSDLLDVHVFGDVARYLDDADVLLGGWGADALFKTLLMANVRHARVLPEQLTAPQPHLLTGIGPHFEEFWLNPFVAAEVRERRGALHHRMQALRPLTAGNWHVLWPIGSQPMAAGYHKVCLGLRPRNVEPFVSNRVYQLALDMPDVWRMERAALRESFLPVLGKAAWQTSTSGRRMGLGPRAGAALARATRASWRRWDRVTGRAGKQGPWSPMPSRLDLKDHLTGAELLRVEERLERVIAGGAAKAFLQSAEIGIPVRVRAMTLAYDDPESRGS